MICEVCYVLLCEKVNGKLSLGSANLQYFRGPLLRLKSVTENGKDDPSTGSEEMFAGKQVRNNGAW